VDAGWSAVSTLLWAVQWLLWAWLMTGFLVLGIVFMAAAFRGGHLDARVLGRRVLRYTNLATIGLTIAALLISVSFALYLAVSGAALGWLGYRFCRRLLDRQATKAGGEQWTEDRL